MVTAVLNDDLFTREVTNDPYTYLGRLREEDPVHWNELYELWVITRHDDLVWLTRHHELFSSEVLKRIPGPRTRKSMQRTWDCTSMSGISRLTSSSSTIALSIWRCARSSMGILPPDPWRPGAPWCKPLSQSSWTLAEVKGGMDVMADFATPLPVLVIAQMMGVPTEDRPYIRELAKKLLAGAREPRPVADPDRRHAGHARVLVPAGRRAYRQSRKRFRFRGGQR